MPSRTYWHFLFDFAVSFFGILAVLAVSDIRMWAMLGMLAMLSSIIRCSLSWQKATKDTKQKLRRTLFGAIGMLVIFGIIYGIIPLASHVLLAGAVFVIVLIFVVYSSRK
jgi:inner membrane protein involved in colicin E2 resistance